MCFVVIWKVFIVGIHVSLWCPVSENDPRLHIKTVKILLPIKVKVTDHSAAGRNKPAGDYSTNNGIVSVNKSVMGPY